MRVTVKMFAAAREAVGRGEVTVDVPEGTTVAEVRSALCKTSPQVRAIVERAMFAVDARYAQEDLVIRENMEVACIPPVSGG